MSSRSPSPYLRKRQPSPDTVNAAAKAVDRADAAPANRSLPHRSRYLVIAVIAAAILFFVSRNTNSTLSLSSTYAICTPRQANIYTVDAARPVAQCFVVNNGVFVDVGSEDEIHERWVRGGAKSYNDTIPSTLHIRHVAPGAVVVPGMTDSHAHILEYGFTKLLPIEGTKTIKETVKRVKKYIESQPDLMRNKSKLVEGWGWDHTKWDPSTWPTADDLERDSVVAGRPIILQSKDGHALWVSRTILAAMEPVPNEIEGGVIVRDSVGNPTGVLLDNAQELANALRPDPTYEQLGRRYNLTVQDAVSRGLTSIHDAGFDPKSLLFFKRAADEGKLTIRVYGMTYFNETADYWGDQADKIVGAGSGRLTARSVKIFADGALRSGGAALYEPYTDNPSTRGFMRIPPEVLNDVIPRFMRDGWQVNVHAIGDRANGLVLDAFEAALKHANVTALRPRLEHAQLLAERDMARFGALGVIASVQPTHATSDMWYAEERLGPERVKGLYAFRSVLDHGGRITLGSDFPVEGINPLASFYAAITRLSAEGTSPHGPEGWFPEQRMSRYEALKGLTLDPAYASFTEDTLGSISIGKRADYVVLSQDIMKIPAKKILDTEILATVIDGHPVYGAI